MHLAVDRLELHALLARVLAFCENIQRCCVLVLGFILAEQGHPTFQPASADGLGACRKFCVRGDTRKMLRRIYPRNDPVTSTTQK